MSPNEIRGLRVALAHYWFVTWRGGEKVARAILDVFPHADIYTLFYEPASCGVHLEGHQIHTSMLDLPLIRSKHQALFPLYPMGVRSLRLKKTYDLIVSSESGPIKGIGNPEGVPHLCYVHSPMRYCWGFTSDYLNALPQIARPLAKAGFESLRRYDETTVSGVDRYVANSRNVQDRVRRFYGRDSSVLYPPIALDLFDDRNLVRTKASQRDYYLYFGAITPYKGVGVLVETFNKSRRPLVIVGDGSERKKLEKLAGLNITFTGALPYSEVREYILGAKALLFPGEEDFGMVPLEVMAHGVPVLAYGRGGALETVTSSADPARSTGIFFAQQGPEAVRAAIEEFEKVQDEFNPTFLRAHARTFGEDHFKEGLIAEVANLLSSPRKSHDQGAPFSG